MAETVTISIVNPPLGGNYYLLSIWNSIWGEAATEYNIPIGIPVTLNVPEGWLFPLLIDLVIYDSIEPPTNVVYRVQSCYGPGWPYYKDISIPAAGNYEYDCAAEVFGIVITDITSTMIGAMIIVMMMTMITRSIK